MKGNYTEQGAPPCHSKNHSKNHLQIPRLFLKNAFYCHFWCDFLLLTEAPGLPFVEQALDWPRSLSFLPLLMLGPHPVSQWWRNMKNCAFCPNCRRADERVGSRLCGPPSSAQPAAHLFEHFYSLKVSLQPRLTTTTRKNFAHKPDHPSWARGTAAQQPPSLSPSLPLAERWLVSCVIFVHFRCTVAVALQFWSNFITKRANLCNE